MKINVYDKVLAGNLGEGWADEWQAAKDLAQEIMDAYIADIEDGYPDAEISVTVTPERSSGYKSEPEVWIDGGDDNDFEIIENIRADLDGVARETWETFCSEYEG